MPEASQFERDEFLTLLSDALRAGPGSPQWHEAVVRLREGGGTEVDEYRLLMAAREHLESGREYRSVRPGPAFTRKVMDAIEQAGSNQPPVIMPANLIAILAGLGILAMILIVGILLLRGAGQGGSLEDLKAMYFSRAAVAGDFSQSIGAGWKKFGLEPVIMPSQGALRGGLFADDPKDYHGGGVYAASALPAEMPFAVEAKVRMRAPTSQVDLQFFVAEQPPLDNSKATSPRELVVELRDGQLSVFRPDGTLAGEPAKAGGEVPLLFKMDRQFVVVERSGKILYAGPHTLSSDKPRYVGVRFLTRGPEKGLEDVTVASMRILRP